MLDWREGLRFWGAIIGLFAAIALLAWWHTAHAADIAGNAMVIDGDTIQIQGQRIRLMGIDAPEVDQPCEANGKRYRCGIMASTVLAQALKGRFVICEPHGKDRYQRVIGLCWCEGGDISQAMVRQGWAVAYRKYSTAYVADEDAARTAALGIWRGPFEMPWDFRKDQQ